MKYAPPEVVKFLEDCMKAEDTYYTRTLPDGAVVESIRGDWSNENAVVLLDSQGLTPEVLARCKELRQSESEQPSRGVFVMIPPDFEYLRDEIEPKLLDIGVHVISADMVELKKKVAVIGAGIPSMMAKGLVEQAPYRSDPDICDFGPTHMKRGGNNKPWVNLALQKRRAKIAKQSKRRNRK